MFFATYVTNLIGTTLFHLQHSVNLPYRERKQKWDFVRAALEGSTFLHVPYFFRPFTNGIEYHHIHHLNTNVPSYKISDCHDLFGQEEKERKNWDDYSINRVDYWLAFKSMFNVMLDEENKQLIPFGYKFWWCRDKLCKVLFKLCAKILNIGNKLKYHCWFITFNIEPT